MQQLELDLWRELKDATEVPELADLEQLWLYLDAALVSLETQQQLQVAGDAIIQVAQIVQGRSLLTLEEIESVTQDSGPVVPADFFDKFVRQSMHVDFAQFIESPPPLPRSLPQRRHQQFPNDGRSLVAVLDKKALLQALEEEDEQELNSEQMKEKLLDTAHSEDVVTWVEAISDYFINRQEDSLSLVELAQNVQYPIVESEKRSSLVRTWLALLLGGFQMEQHTNDFYSLKGIWVRIP
jgi:hypothetical protein